MNAGKRSDSLKKRYSSKVGASGIDFLLSLITAGIAPRGLGPAAYGNFEFLSSFFMQFVGFFDAGTSTCFYTKLSKRPNDAGLVRFYWLVVLGLSGLTGTLVLGALLLNLDDWLWPGQSVFFICMAAVWGLLIWCSRVIAKVVDAYGLTVPGEMCRIAQRVVGTALLLSLFYWTRFSLTQFFFITFSSYFFYVPPGGGFYGGRGGLCCPNGPLPIKHYGRMRLSLSPIPRLC